MSKKTNKNHLKEIIFISLGALVLLIATYQVLIRIGKKQTPKAASSIHLLKKNPEAGTVLTAHSDISFSYDVEYFSSGFPTTMEVYCLLVAIPVDKSKPQKLFSSKAEAVEQKGVVNCAGSFMVPSEGEVQLFVSLREAQATETTTVDAVIYKIQKVQEQPPATP